MSEILVCMGPAERRDHAMVAGALMQKTFGESPAMTAYLQGMGVLSQDADRIAGCEAFGATDGGAKGELSHGATGSMSRLDAIHSRVEDASARADRDLDELDGALNQARQKKRHFDAAGIAAVLAVAHVGISTARGIWNLMSARRADKKELSNLLAKKSQMMSAFTAAKKEYRTTGGANMDALTTAQTNAAKVRNETRALLTALKNKPSPMKLIAAHPGATAAGMAISLGCYFVVYWILTKIVLGAVHWCFGKVDHASEAPGA